ncbi:hypothetical protein GCM10010393_34650 [Streptomyces gobitricini]|uniref:Uncharacterized protein n=1 Tax=Streptomyces gobitricini TaxID=68211 RepID=A0ABN3MBZ7_9ACTN
MLAPRPGALYDALPRRGTAPPAAGAAPVAAAPPNSRTPERMSGQDRTVDRTAGRTADRTAGVGGRHRRPGNREAGGQLGGVHA